MLFSDIEGSTALLGRFVSDPQFSRWFAHAYAGVDG